MTWPGTGLGGHILGDYGVRICLFYHGVAPAAQPGYLGALKTSGEPPPRHLAWGRQVAGGSLLPLCSPSLELQLFPQAPLETHRMD